MGAGCTTCTIFDDVETRDRRHNTDARSRLIRLPDPTSNQNDSNDVADDSNDSKEHMEYGGYDLDPVPIHKQSLSERRAMFEPKKEESDEKKKIEKTKQSNQKSKLSDRRAMFENTNANAKTVKSTKPIPINNNKPKKKWTVKGIDDKSANQKKVVHVTSSAPAPIKAEEEPSISVSHKDRMKMYEQDIASTEEKAKQRMQKHKEERGGYSGIAVSAEQKERAKKLLQERVEKQKKGDITGGDEAGGIVLSVDVAANDIALAGDDNTQTATATAKKPKKRTLNELLKDATDSDGTAIVKGMNLIQSEFDHKEKKDLAILNMNNDAKMAKMTEEQKLKFMYLIAHSVVDSKSDAVERVTMCNAGIEDKMMMEFVKVIVENKEKVRMQELWLESNPIGNDGMKALCQLIECNLECLRIIKLYNNKKNNSTPICDQMLESLDKNDKIIKFTYSFRFQQQKDKLAKILRRNQELRRKARLKEKNSKN